MRSLVLALLVPVLCLSLAGCSSEPGNAVDAAYLKALEDMATATCECVGKPDASVCGPKAFANKPKPPSGEDSTAYEKGLKESDKKKTSVARGKAMQCILTITRDARAAAGSGASTSPATGAPATGSPATASPATGSP